MSLLKLINGFQTLCYNLKNPMKHRLGEPTCLGILLARVVGSNNCHSVWEWVNSLMPKR